MPLRKSGGANKYFFLLTIFFFRINTIDFYCQEEEEIQISRIDSVLRYQGIIPPIEFQYNLDEIFSNTFPGSIPEEILFSENPSTIWLRTELYISYQNTQFGRDKIGTHFTLPLYQQYLKEAEFNMARYVLGLAQTSAVAYMAYRHIKKYGFWK
jgi:hypothetical protein